MSTSYSEQRAHRLLTKSFYHYFLNSGFFIHYLNFFISLPLLPLTHLEQLIELLPVLLMVLQNLEALGIDEKINESHEDYECRGNSYCGREAELVVQAGPDNRTQHSTCIVKYLVQRRHRIIHLRHQFLVDTIDDSVSHC